MRCAAGRPAASALDLRRHRQLAGLAVSYSRSPGPGSRISIFVVPGNAFAEPVTGRAATLRQACTPATSRRACGVAAAFEVQQNVHDILLDAFHRRCTRPARPRFRISGDRRPRQARTAALGAGALPERVAEAAFERFDHDARMARRHWAVRPTTRGFKNSLVDPLHGYLPTLTKQRRRRSEALRCAKNPVRCSEYNSTTRLSLMSGRIS